MLKESVIFLLILGAQRLLCDTYNVTTITKRSEVDWCSECLCLIKEENSLNCKGKKIQEFPLQWPKELVGEKNLEEKHLMATFSNNNISKLEKIPKIGYKKIFISLVRCGLKEISYEAFKNIPQIFYLNLGHNKLTGDAVRGDIFRGPPNNRQYEPIDLTILNLEYNFIHSLDRRMFQHIPNLKTLYLNNNPINVLDTVTILAISSLTNLETLDISNIGIDSLPDDFLRNSKHLQQLNLSGNKLTTIPESLGSLGSSLQNLLINKNKIQELNDNSFLGLWRLESLEIGQMDTLTEVKAGTFAQLLSLKTLHLCHNPNLKHISHNAFRELKLRWPIQELHINDNGLTRIPSDLAVWETLIRLNIENNPLECNCEAINDFMDNGIAEKLLRGTEPMCISPMEVSGEKLKNVLKDNACPPGRKNSTVTSFGGPYRQNRMFISITRPGSVFVGLAFVCIVVVVGLSAGCILSYIRRKIRRVISMEPVKYTNIRMA